MGGDKGDSSAVPGGVAGLVTALWTHQSFGAEETEGATPLLRHYCNYSRNIEE